MSRRSRAFLKILGCAALGLGVAGALGAARGSSAGGAGLGPLKCSRQITSDRLINFKAPHAKRPYKITLILISLDTYYFQAVAYGASKAAHDARAQLVYATGSGFSTPAQQLTEAENAVQKGTDAIVLEGADVNGSAPIAALAAKHHIPVVAVGTYLNADVDQVLQDDYKQGGQAADELAKELPHATGDGIVMAGPNNQTYAINRTNGFEARIKAKYPHIHILAAPNTNDDPADGSRAFINALQAHPSVAWVYSTANAIVLPNSIPANLRGKLKYVTSGWNPPMVAGLAQGNVSADMDAAQVGAGYVAASTAIDELNGKATPKMTCLQNVVLTPRDLHTPYAKYETYPPSYKPGG